MLIFDCEILNAIPDKKTPEKGINYCKGWEDFEGMGIACICCYDYATEKYRVFDDKNLDSFWELLNNRNCIIGFNNHKFDNNLLRTHYPKDLFSDNDPLKGHTSFDVLREVWLSLGLTPPATDNDFIWQLHGGYGLDALCKTNFGLSKTGKGDLAPIAWQRGKYAEVIDYCLNDVFLTKKLVDRILLQGWLHSPKDVRRISINVPPYMNKYKP